MDVNRRGDLVGGVAQHAWIKPRGGAARVLAEDAHQPCWLTDDVIAWQAQAFSNDGVNAHVVTSDGQSFPFGAAPLRAGGGVLRAFVTNRIVGPGGVNIPGAGKHWVGRDGTFVYCKDFNTEGHGGIVIQFPDGTKREFLQERVISSMCLDREAVGWFPQAGRLRFFNGASVTDVTLPFPTWEGRLFRYRGDVWIIHQDQTSGVRLYALKDVSRGFHVAQGQAFYPVAYELDGVLHVAVSRGAGALKDELSEHVITGEPQPWAVPAVTVPTFVESPYAIGVGMFDDMAGPRLMDATEVPTGNVRAIFHHVGRGSVPASMAVAKQLRVPCLFWWDKHGADPSDVPPTGRALLFAYPMAGRSVHETVKQFQRDATRMIGAGVPFDVGMGLYRQWNGTRYVLDEQHVLDCAAAVWKAAIALKAGAVWIFSKTRGAVDGVDHILSFTKALNRMKGASPDWRTFPKVTAAPPSPQPVPTPEPDMPHVIDGYTYEQFNDLGRRIDERYRAVNKASGGHGDQPPAGTDVTHNLWRVLREGMSEQEMLNRIDPNFS